MTRAEARETRARWRREHKEAVKSVREGNFPKTDLDREYESVMGDTPHEESIMKSGMKIDIPGGRIIFPATKEREEESFNVRFELSEDNRLVRIYLDSGILVGAIDKEGSFVEA